MKRSIAVIFDDIIVGGAEKSLIQFLRSIDSEHYEVTLFTRRSQHAYTHLIPSHVRVQETVELFENVDRLLVDDIKHLRLFRVANTLWSRIRLLFCNAPFQRLLLTHRLQRRSPQKFDCGIAYKLSINETAFLLERINAEKKCAWIHGIVEYREKHRLLYKKVATLHKLFCVSKYAMAQFNDAYPQLASKTEVFYNLIDQEEIIRSAHEPISETLKGIKLVTVGRLDPAKGLDLVPKTARILLDAGCDIHWYFVGDGPERKDIEEGIAAMGLENRVILLGSRMNPYPYIDACDIYVQTSRSEGWCLTVQEAKVLCRPIVTTNLPVFREQITHGVNGSIATDLTPEALAAEIIHLIEHPQVRQSYSDTLRAQSHSTSDEMQKLYDFMDS